MTSRRADADANRERILVAARLAFTEGGPSAPVRTVARRAGVGAATVYRHFPTKQALLDAAFARERALCSTIVDDALAADDPWQGLARAIERLLVATTENPRVVAELTRAGAFTDDRARSVRGMAELLRRAKAGGMLREEIVLEDVLLALQAGRGIQATTPAGREAATRRLAALIVQSFRAAPDATPLPPAARLRA
ncbi:TetR/AcrR family transcriptional regulator [Pseudonocardia sp. WMMC193]|uniref:TetR/AcrR family transcriptional regulator n=1 Tax=Pseudonocardia sp. WMMC193 TaxID=2911965 RepID=UPI001F030ABB|nr:TetR/AcrR family transcriptional regulator [Pseudonocardia sp. WMMC193]MCF7548273.1 TetR family transcriptional regulator [Pseudonocardia sp. WMMC193]